MIKRSPETWFKPEELSSLKGMTWLARKIANEVISGAHSGRYLGQGTDFSQYRTYMPGDDLRRVDWKLYGRTDRLYLKESEMESRTKWHGIIDASASMLYEEGGISKWQYARILWAAVDFIAKKQGDTSACILINDKELTHFSQPDALQLNALFEAEASGKWPLHKNLPLKMGLQNKLILITDFYEKDEEIGTFIKTLNPVRNEIIVFHVMGQQEIALDFEGITAYKDAETGRVLETDTIRIRNEYKKRAEDFLIKSRNKVLSWGADYLLFKIPYSPVQNLKVYLSKSKGGRNVGNR